MAKSLEQFYGSQGQKKKKDEDVGFFESALAGVATGLWNIPKGVFSLGATVMDLVGDTNMARDVEEWFDDINPWDDEAEARTIGKITTAISSIAIPATYGFKAGSAAAKAWQTKNATSLAKAAIEAKRANKYFSLARAGNLIAKTPGRAKLTGGIIGAGAGEALVADEDIGTFADMARGTSLEPYALTMMNKDENMRGRQDAFRRLLNRLKFGTEGALFNLALVGAGKGIQKLRKPKDSLDAYSKNKLEAFIQKYGEFGLGSKGMAGAAAFEAKEASKGIEKATAIAASNLTNSLEGNLRELGDTFYDGYLKSKGAIRQGQTGQQRVLEDIQKIISPRSFEADRLLDPNLAKAKLGEIEPVFELKKLQKELLEVAQSNKNLGDESLEKLVVDLKNRYNNLIKQHPNVVKQAKELDEKGIFNVKDLNTSKELEELLKKVEASAGPEVAKQLKGNIFDMRLAVDNMSARLLQKQMPKEVAETIKENFGRYLNTTYRQYEQKGFFGLWKYKPTQQIIDRSEELFVESKLRALGRKATPDELIRIKDAARTDVEAFARKMAVDDVDPRAVSESNIGKDVINEVQVKDSILKKAVVEPWQRELLGEIKDPSYTFFNTVSKQANLNATLSYMDDIAKIGAEGENAFIIDPEQIIQSRITKAKKDRLVGYTGPAFDEAADEALEQKIRASVTQDIGFLDTNKWRKVENSASVPTPLDGKYVKAPMYDSIFETSSNWLNQSHAGQFYKTVVLAPKAGSQIAKTILSPLTHVRNALSAGAFVSANGAFFPNYGDWKLLNPFSNQSVYKQAYGISGKRVFGTMTKADTEMYQKLLKVGVVDSQVQASETKRLFRDMFKDPSAVDRGMVNVVPKKVGMETKRKLLKGFAKLQDAYVAEDDFWKIINWNLERNRYSQITEQLGVTSKNFKALIDYKVPIRDTMGETAEQFAKRQAQSKQAIEALGENGEKIAEYFSNLSQRRGYIEEGVDSIAQYSNFLDEVAGNLTRNNVPNYAYVGRTARALRQSPFGNFIAFPLEIMRTGNNVLTRSIDDIATGIPEIQKLGYKRLTSFGATVIGVPAAVVGSAKAYHDVDDEEMDALRRIVPEWSKNSSLVPMGRDKNGYLKYIDFSYANAYDSLVRPVMAVYRGLAESGENKESLADGLGAGMMDSMSEILKPYATESIYTEALIDSTFRRGVGRGGKKIWSPEDDFGVRAFKGIAHVASSLSPGSLSQFKRLAQAASGVSDDYGKTFNLSDEIHGLYGMRVINSDPERAMKYKTTAFGSNLKKDQNLFIAPLLKGGRVSPDEIIDRYGYSESRRFHTMKEMYKDVQAMRKLGMKDFKIRNELERRKGIKRDTIDELLRGDYTPERPSEFFIERIGDITRELNQSEGVTIPNPYFKAVPYINKIINNNRRLDLNNDAFEIPKLNLPSYTGTLGKKVGRLTSNIMSNNNTASIQPSAQVVNATNQGSGVTTPYAQMSTSQKIEYDKLMRGIG